MCTEDGYEEDDEEERYGPVVATESGWIPKLFEANYRTTQLVFTEKNGQKITCLRQPRDLYALKSASHAGPRWPIEMQVLTQRPYHILYTPPRPELLFKKDREVNPPHKSSVILGKVVYDNSPDPEIRYFISSKSDNKLPKLKPYYTLQDENDKTLIFESRFESGNLMRAIKVGEYDYQLWLKFDLYTKKYTQWYYFQIKNTRPNVTYKFTIMNFLKSGSLYNEGMRPLLYSENDAKQKNVGWKRAGSNIKYYKNDIKVEENRERCYYSLYWTCTFVNENDTYFFAHSYPYTYSDMQEYLTFLSSDPDRKKVCKQRVLCETLAGNYVYCLTITSPTRCPKEAKLKKAIVLTARVHPGETIASWIMKGLLDFLTSNEPDALVLRETFIFKVIPMLNPDGVVIGNYRCSLSGRDLNRNYKTVLKDSFPPVWAARYLIKRLQEEREVIFYCDIHGHSKKKNVFMYGCQNKNESIKKIHSRVFPWMYSKNAPEKFSFSGCRFRVQKSKEGTGRVVMWNLGIRYSYTLEASFCGSSHNNNYHFGVQDYEMMGYHFLDTLLDFYDPDMSKFNKALHEIQERMLAAVMKKMEVDQREVNLSDIDLGQWELISELETDSCGSDSSLSDGLPMQILHATIPEISKKKRLKTRKERNKSRKPKKIPAVKNTHPEPVPCPEPEVEVILRPKSLHEPSPVEKPEKQRKHTKRKQPAKIVYTNRNTKEQTSRCITPSRVTSTNEMLDNLAYSYVQAGLIDNSLTDPSLKCNKSPCGQCNPDYFLTYGHCDGEVDSRKNNYSLFEICMPRRNDINPTLELARRITAYNYRTGQVPTRMSRVFSMWADESRRREQLWKRRTLNQGDNTEYLRQKLQHINTNVDFELSSKKQNDTFRPYSESKTLSQEPSNLKFSTSNRNIHSQSPTRAKKMNSALPIGGKYLPKLNKTKYGILADTGDTSDASNHVRKFNTDVNGNLLSSVCSTTLNSTTDHSTHTTTHHGGARSKRRDVLKEKPTASGTSSSSGYKKMSPTSSDSTSRRSDSAHSRRQNASAVLTTLTSREYSIFKEPGRRLSSATTPE